MSAVTTPGFRRFADGSAVGDVIPFAIDGEYHLFVLTPPPGSVHFPERLRATWRHLRSTDLVHWDELPPALEPGGPGQPDDGGIWTGSVVYADGTWHMFYTGHASDLTQTICHATSPDGTSWTKDPANPISVADPERFETRDWRDPFVVWDEAEGEWWMLATARTTQRDAPGRGVIVRSRSADLATWSRFEIYHETFLTHAPECPEIFRLGDSWILGYSRFTDRRGTIYLEADSAEGPWRVRGSGQPDSDHWYAAKGLSTQSGRRFAFGWIPDRDPTSDSRGTLWGGDLAVPRELVRGDSGVVLMQIPGELAAVVGDNASGDLVAVQGAWSMASTTATGSVSLALLGSAADLGDYRVSVRFTLNDEPAQVGLLIATNDELDRGVGILYSPQTADLRAVDLTTKRGEGDSYVNISGQYGTVAEHRLARSLGSDVSFEVIVRGDLVEAFVGGVCCLTYRTDGSPTNGLAVVVVDGDVTVAHLERRPLWPR